MSAPLETTNLVKHYFNICNTALTSGADRALYGALVKLLEELAGGSTITLRVVDTESGVEPCYTTQFADGQFTPIVEGERDPDTHFTLSERFLREVVENADAFIEHPERLDWSWLRPRA